MAKVKKHQHFLSRLEGGQTVRPASKQKTIKPVSQVQVEQAKTMNNMCLRLQAGKK